ncbi:MAG: right-handed parallel beta-helix repeat-containing protein [Oscillospiraceae bacterium]|nr:right-handed parallel beta-helix repeat-containing protein [Oscillospiraceae bacterium]
MRKAAFLVLIYMLLLLCGCGTEPAEAPVQPSAVPEGVTRVKNIDEFLNALASDSIIELVPGEYMLSDAKSYGKSNVSDYYRWVSTYDGYELQLENIEKLSIIGSGMESCRILTEPRGVNVLSIDSCKDLDIKGITLGHTDSGVCSGGVLNVRDSEGIALDGCELFGCGTVALTAEDSKCISLESSVLRDCSIRAVEANSCYDVRLENCEIYSCGIQGQPSALFMVSSTEGFALINSSVYGNEASVLLAADYSGQLSFLGNQVSKNRLYEGMFALRQYAAVVDGCSFEDNSFEHWYAPEEHDTWMGQGSAVKATNIRGAELDDEALSNMLHQNAVYNGPIPRPSEILDSTQDGKIKVVDVESADEFLAAIGPNTQINIKSSLIDLSLASDYGSYGGDYYSWRSCFDGPELVIKNVENLSIVGLGRDKCTISADPRYANVLNFENCSKISIKNLTAGHSKESGSCTGGVLSYVNCKEPAIENCGLFGCGILGINASDCRDMAISATEIYECSVGAANFYNCKNVEFTDCIVRDVPQPAFYLDNACDSVSFNGRLLPNGMSSSD